MIAQGRVENGVVVFTDAVRLPEGQLVTVVANPSTDLASHGILDIPTVSLGAVVTSTAFDDVLGELLEGRV